MTNLIPKIYFLMNKPTGYVCSHVSDSHKTVYDLLSPELQQFLHAKRGERLHTVGRLDCETSGLLLFTNDGNFSHLLTDPENHIPKTYIATLKNPVQKNEQNEYLKYFSKPHTLPAEKKSPDQTAEAAKIEFLSDTECKVTITQGKFHQVRRMFLPLGNEVIKLHRIAFGEYSLPETLCPGEYHFFDN